MAYILGHHWHESEMRDLAKAGARPFTHIYHGNTPQSQLDARRRIGGNTGRDRWHPFSIGLCRAPRARDKRV